MQNLLFQTASVVSNSCTFGGLNTNDWVGISALVILLSLTISGLVYLIANFMAGREGAKMKGYVKYEFGQAIISMVIIVIILGIASTACSVSLQFTNPSQDSFSFAQHYVGGLLFVSGIGLMNNIYSTSIAFTIYSGVLTGLATALPDLPLNPILKLGKDSPFQASVGAPDLSSVYKNYATVLTDVYIPLIILSFSMLFLQFLTLPLIQATALTVVLPIALIMRSLSFTGPRLKQAANEFLAIAIAFYFIFPMTFIMDAQIINWMYCTPAQTTTCSNPYPQYSGSYVVPGLTQSSLFGSTPDKGFGIFGTQLPSQFYGSAGSQFINTVLSAKDPLTSIFAAPAIVVEVGMQVAGYMFQTTVLIALNLAITIGLAAGLSKGIGQALNFLGSESIFS